MTQMKKQHIDILSVLSCIAVVFLHTNGCFWEYSTEAYWKSANFIECLFYFAVPVFFMISGATLINYQERYDTREFFRKRIHKTVIPFLAWSFVGLIWELLRKHVLLNNLTFIKIINGIINSEFIGVYWFFAPLFSLYLCIPLFAAVEKQKRKEVFSIFVVMGFIINIVLPFFNNVFSIGIRIPFSVSVASGYLIYLMSGYLISEYNIILNDLVIAFLIIAGFLVHFVGTQILSDAAGEIISNYKGYVNLPCVMNSIGIFMFVKKNESKIMESVFGKIIELLKKYTFSIYMLHYFVMEIVRAVFFHKLLDIPTTSMVYRLLSPIIIIPLCILITNCIRRIPVLRRILPE